MDDDIAKLDQRITQIKQRKEKLQTQKALLIAKEAQAILGKEYSPELVLSILFHSWSSASQKQKEGWINSTHSFRKKSKTQQSKENKSPRKIDSDNETENL